MWHAIYKIGNGALVSIGTVLADPLPGGMAAKQYADLPGAGMAWDASVQDFVAVPPAPVLLVPQDFMGRFTVAEETAIRARAMSDASMLTFLARVERARTVCLSHPDTIAGMNYILSLGLITAARHTEILDG
jgi:hypothetical protein